jgi:hypothetical protein
MLKRITGKLGLLEFAKDCFVRFKYPEKWQADCDDLNSIYAQLGQGIKPDFSGANKVVLGGMGSPATIAQESLIMKAFEKAGYRPVMWVPRGKLIRRSYAIFGVHHLVFNDEYWIRISSEEANHFLDEVNSLDDLINNEWNGARVGRFAVSSFMRVTRLGTVDINNHEVRTSLRSYIKESMAACKRAKAILDKARPDAVTLIDRGYTPGGELFDLCMNRDIPVYTWNAGHKNGCFILKRYTKENRDHHPASLSKKSWARLQRIERETNLKEKTINEIQRCYATGEWFAEVATQVGRRLVNPEEVEKQLNLDAQKKTACIFSHIFWDATFFWGVDLFDNYEDWFVKTVRAACENTRLNWLIKVHPANHTKNIRDGVEGEASEMAAIRKVVPQGLPEHVKVIEAKDKLNTYSLFQVLDYCLTVRGTVGIEAAALGIRTLTAGTGRYDRHGFTKDFGSTAEYLRQLCTLHELPSPTKEEIKRALRFAYGVFLLRPTPTMALNSANDLDEGAKLRVRFNVSNDDEFLRSPEICKLAEWIETEREDFIWNDSNTT